MELNEYQKSAFDFALHSSRNLQYMLLGLGGEVGELSSLFAKAVRGNESPDRDSIKKELGDCLWFVSGMCSIYGWTLEDIAKMNIDKLDDRRKRNVIHGDGDNR